MKVYCKNCKFGDDYYYCDHPSNKVVEKYESYRSVYFYNTWKSVASFLNRNNDCKNFEKKPWWKFW